MRIREMTHMGRQVWPPQWSSSSQPINEEAVLKGVKVIIGTDLLRIDIDHNGMPHLGIMAAEQEIRDSLYHKLKENVGRQLTEIADLEIDIDREKPILVK